MLEFSRGYGFPVKTGMSIGVMMVVLGIKMDTIEEAKQEMQGKKRILTLHLVEAFGLKKEKGPKNSLKNKILYTFAIILS